jgi:hypothetical protein
MGIPFSHPGARHPHHRHRAAAAAHRERLGVPAAAGPGPAPLPRNRQELPHRARPRNATTIGQQHRRFRFDKRFRALLGGSRRQLESQFDQGFPFLPPGCRLVLDRVSQQAVLASLRASLTTRRPALLGELRALASVAESFCEAVEESLTRAIGTGLLHLDDPDRLRATAAALALLWQAAAWRDELRQLLQLLAERTDRRLHPLPWALPIPVRVHGRYSRAGSTAKASSGTNPALFSPSTRYRDLALGPSLFHWESQSTTTAASPTGQRTIHHEARGSRVLLLVREHRREGERPMAIRWRLERPIPAGWMQRMGLAV